ncbi:hypothetical protein K3495_g4850 [Podosphaera aphanis]|nr:hypothetical protein K3495_g4850 [Podosphaera aphanis]
MVDLYERLPVPYGLVRFGVAPDHPEVKNCQETFQKVASSPRMRFIGNVPIGEEPGSLPLELLVPHYDAILVAYGAARDRPLDIPGEAQLRGVYSARAFVGWYNGLPEYANLAPDLTAGEEVTVIGQGNVALDIARILLQEPAQLRASDITENALDTLCRSRTRRVRIVGRRGPVQAAFTIKELRELTKLPSVRFEPILDSLLPSDSLALPRVSARIMSLLKKTSRTPTEASTAASKSVALDFCLSPTAMTADPAAPAHLGGVTFEKTILNPHVFDPQARPTGTGELVEMPCSLAFVSIGYKAELAGGFEKVGLPFDDRLGVIPNDGYGRVQLNCRLHPLPRFYCTGWVKNGPTGNIATTMFDAFLTAETITSDWLQDLQSKCVHHQESKHGWEALQTVAARRGCRAVSWADWQKIDKAEQEIGHKRGKEREKFTRVEEMLTVLD